MLYKLLVIIFSLAVIALTFPAVGFAENLAEKMKVCRGLEDKGWSPQEKYVWEKVCLGQSANLNKFNPPPPAEFYYPKNEADFANDSKWRRRQITSRFLYSILFDEGRQKEVTHKGVVIIGAWFKKDIDLSYANLRHVLKIEYSRFGGKVDLTLLNSKKMISFTGSMFVGELNLNGVAIDDNLAIERIAVNGKVDLVGARIIGELDARFSEISDEIDMENIYVGGNVSLKGVTVKNKIHLLFSRINGYLDLRRCQTNFLNLTDAIIGSEIDLGPNGEAATRWTGESIIILRNTKAGILIASQKSWPDKVDLVGFTYSRLGGFYAKESERMHIDSIPWLDWLAKQKPFSPQPYEQLAKVLKGEGHTDMVNTILYTMRERHRTEVVKSIPYQCLLFFEKYVIGYGYEIYLVCLWIIGSTFLGAFFLRLSGEGVKHGMPYGFSFSLDLLLPIIRLRAFHHDEVDIKNWVRYYFYFHKVWGYILASFLIAGLSGLTK